MARREECHFSFGKEIHFRHEGRKRKRKEEYKKK